MLRRNDEHEFVEIYDHRMQAGFLRLVGEHAELRAVAQHVVGNVAAQRALHLDLDHGMQAAELGQQRQQVEHGEFVGRDDQLAFLQFAQFSQRFGGLAAQVDQLFGVFEENLAGVGEDALARRSVEKSFAEFVLELADGLAYRRLGAEEFFGGAGEAVLAGDRQKYFKLRKFHETAP